MKTTIKTYNDIIYDSRPVKLSEYLSDKYDKIHSELYQDALEKAIADNFSGQDIDDVKSDYNIIEYKNTEYWMPSTVVFREKKVPYKKHLEISLEPYWNYHQKFEHKSIDKYVNNINQINDFHIISFNYITGIATLKSRLSGEEIELPFEYIDKDTPVDDTMKLDTTFTSLRSKNML